MAVFLSHLSWARLSGGFLWWLQPYGHSAVTVFFVLSGFVIQFTVSEKEKTFYDYSLARFARLYSVVVPALILTLVCDSIGTHQDPSVYLMERETNPLLRLFAAFLFLGQSWWWNLSVLSNDPFWSLPYEFWYYQIFGAAIFFKGVTRILLIGLAVVIAGPTILLLFPIWLLGVVVYRASKKISLDWRVATGLFIVSAVAIIGLLAMDGREMIHRSTSAYLPPGFSLLDFVMGAMVGLNIFAASFLRIPVLRAETPIRFMASFTFALYLFHLPLLHLGAAFLPKAWSVNNRGLCLAAFTFLMVFVIGLITERKKKAVRASISWIFNLVISKRLSSA